MSPVGRCKDCGGYHDMGCKAKRAPGWPRFIPPRPPSKRGYSPEFVNGIEQQNTLLTSQRDKLVGIVEKLLLNPEHSQVSAAVGLSEFSEWKCIESCWRCEAERLLAEIRGGANEKQS